MSLQFGLSLPQGWNMELAGIKDPIEAYEVMTRVAQTADEGGRELGCGNSELGEAADSLVRIDELEDALGEEDAPYHETHDQGGPRSRERRVEQQVDDSL